MKLGNFELIVLSDGTFALDGGQLFGVVPKVLWEKKIPADDRNRVHLSLTCLLIRTGNANVLLETGIGDKFEPKFQQIYAVDHSRTLLGGLKKAGVGAEDIDVVVNTHLHFDHCGGNLRREDDKLVPAFPKAKYYVQRGEWKHALAPSERDRANYVQAFFLAGEPQTQLLEGDAEIVPGVRVEVMPGHTRDLQCVRIESQGEQACFLSDLVPTSAHLASPWIASLDLYPMDTLASKKRLLAELAAEEALVIFPHDPQVPLMRLLEIEGKIATEAV